MSSMRTIAVVTGDPVVLEPLEPVAERSDARVVAFREAGDIAGAEARS